LSFKKPPLIDDSIATVCNVRTAAMMKLSKMKI